MELCLLCSRIKLIRVKQKLDYYDDLCAECKKKELLMRQVSLKKKIAQNWYKKKKSD